MSLRPHLAIALAFWPALLAGCARLEVEVTTLNRDYWSSTEYATGIQRANIVRTADAIRNGAYDQRIANCIEWADKGIDQLKNAKNEFQVPIMPADPALINGIKSSVETEIKNGWGTARAQFECAFDLLILSDREARKHKQEEYTRKAIAKYAEGAATLRGLTHKVFDAFLGGVPMVDLSSSDKTVATTMASATANAVDQQAGGFITGHDILDDPRTPYVVNAPLNFWQGSFNHTIADGRMGDVDIAIRMESIGNFTIKGVRNDAAKITQATFSVGRAAIQTVAAVYGVPLPRPNATPAPATTKPAGDSKDTPVDTTPGFDSPARRLADARNATQQLRLTRLAMLELITANRAGLTSPDDATRKTALTNFRPLMDGYIKDLQPATTGDTK